MGSYDGGVHKGCWCSAIIVQWWYFLTECLWENIFGKFIFTNIPKFILKFKKIFSIYILPSLLVVIALDLGLNFLGFGYPSHYTEEKILRYPTPMDSFSGKPNEMGHNEFGFRGKFENKINYLSIAFFGGSTGYLGEPTIIENIKLGFIFLQLSCLQQFFIPILSIFSKKRFF